MSELSQVGSLQAAETPVRAQLVSDEERHRMLLEWNATEMEYPRESCVHHLFEAQARRTPDAVAVRFGDQTLTYSALDARANQLARYLGKLGIGPDVLVGLCVERSLGMMVALLGILKAGGAYVPLDPAYPKDRLAFILEDARVQVLLTEERLAGGWPNLDAKSVCLDTDWNTIARESTVSPASTVAAHHRAYVLYTSGSTGKPKGVQIEHRNVVNFLCTMREQPGITASDVLVAVTTLSFDIAGLELFLPLTVGARVVIASRGVASDGSLLMAALAEQGASIMQATPATWRLLLDAGWQGSPQLKILCGGEAFPRELALQLMPCGASLWNMYGPTETTIWSSTYKVEGDVGALLPIGRPIGNTQMYILDPDKNPVPVGVEGELYIAGAGVARGYLHRPELTAEKFVADPFRKVAGARMYRTGDLARYQDDGDIIFLGRIDHQVKIRGFRIELGEIEAILAEHPAVRQNVVVAREDVPGDKRLVAYLVPRDTTVPAARELRAFLQKQLPDYMLPAAFMPMTALPLTPNGKVDRKALPAPDPGDDLVKEFVAPRDPVEVRLASLWEKVLKVHPVGATTNFFDLGANSLAGARLFTEIGKVFDKDLPVSTLFDAPSVETLANLLRDEKTAARWSSLVAIQPGGSHPPFFCVHGGTGATFFLHDLADNLGTEQPFYGLQMEGMDGRRITRTHIEQMAAHYLSEARTLQPEGPYYLGGYCFGGVVALEMARILLEQGQEVGLLALLNAPNPKVQPSDEFDEDEGALADEAAGQKVPAEFTASKQRGHMAALRNLPRRARWTYLKGAVKLGIQWRVRSFRQQRYKPFRRKFIERASMACAALNRPVPPSWRNFYLLHLTHIAEHHYVTRFYPGTMTIFRGKGLDRDPHVGWQGWVKHIESIEIEGHHKMRASMMRKPLVEKLAEQVRRRLERARREASVSQEAGAVAGSTHQR